MGHPACEAAEQIVNVQGFNFLSLKQSVPRALWMRIVTGGAVAIEDILVLGDQSAEQTSTFAAHQLLRLHRRVSAWLLIQNLTEP
jgi:hypothetical protein